MTGFAFETAFELVLFGLVPMVLIVGTVWILWHVQEKIYSDVTDIKSFLTFILVIDDAMNAGSGWSPFEWFVAGAPRLRSFLHRPNGVAMVALAHTANPSKTDRAMKRAGSR